MTKVEGIVKSVNVSDIHWMPKNHLSLYRELKEGIYKDIEENGDEYDVLFLEGDYFHEKLQLNDDTTKLAIKFLYELLTLCKEKFIKVRAIRGTKSHDFDQLENFRSYEKEFDFKIFNTVEVEELFPNFFVLYIPEEYMDNQDKYYEEFFNLEDDAKYDMIVFHGTFDFTAFDSQKQESERQISNAPVFNSVEMLDICYGLIIGGHIHQHRKYKKRIVYNGSYSCNSFDEFGKHGFIVAEQEIDTGEVTWELKENKLAPKYVTFEAEEDFSEMDFESKMDTLDEIRTEGDFVRLKLSALVFDTITELMMFKEKANTIKNLKLEISDSSLIDIKKVKNNDKIEDVIEDQTEDTTYDFITKENNSIMVNVRKYIKVKNNVDIPEEKIQEIMVDVEKAKSK